MCPFVPIFVSSVSAKYYLNWFTFGKVITEMKRVNFLLIHSVVKYDCVTAYRYSVH